MRIVKVGVLAPTNKGVPLGVQGESCATEVEFDVRPWLREYPSGTVSAVARREGDPAPYPLTLDVADGMAVWAVSDTDTAKAGEGAVELTLTSAGVRVRSLTFKTLVTASLTDAPVDDDAWYGWLDKAVVKVDETVQAAQRKLSEVDQEWTGLKADVNAKVDECSKAAAQAAEDAHRAKVDAQATAKALESAEGSTAKAEAAAKRAEDAAGQAEGFAAQASASEGNASAAVTDARLAAGQAEGFATEASKSARDAMASQVSANDSAGAAADAAADAGEAAANAEKAKAASEEAKAAAAVSEANAATSASDAAESASAAAKSASDAAASVNAINVIAPKSVPNATVASSITEVAIGDGASTVGGYGIAIGQSSHASIGSVAIGSGAIADGGAGNTACAIGDATNASTPFGVALGTASKCEKEKESSFGYSATDGVPEFTREITHVSTPTAASSAATKGYVDTGDSDTLTEAKKYTDDNTTNALIGTVSGKLLHVDDAWPGKPLGLTIDGAYKQDGTPSPDNPVPIIVIENPVLKVTGRNLVNVPDKTVEAKSAGVITPCGLIPSGTEVFLSFVASNNATATNNGGTAWSLYGKGDNEVKHSIYPLNIAKGINKSSMPPAFDVVKHLTIYGYRYPSTAFEMSNYQLEVGGYHDYRPYTSATIPITLPAEHPYLAALPDGTHDEIVIDKDGNASLVARTGKLVLDNQEKWWAIQPQSGGYSLGYSGVLLTSNGLKKNTRGNVLSDKFEASNDFVNKPCVGITEVLWVVPKTNDGNITAKDIADAVVGSCLYAPLVTEAVYQLGKVTVPSLPETISNVWMDAEPTTSVSMTYKQDVNAVIAGLKSQIAALTSKAASDEASTSEPTIESDPEYSTGEPTVE